MQALSSLALQFSRQVSVVDGSDKASRILKALRVFGDQFIVISFDAISNIRKMLAGSGLMNGICVIFADRWGLLQS
jgi:hypothetical protein